MLEKYPKGKSNLLGEKESFESKNRKCIVNEYTNFSNDVFLEYSNYNLNKYKQDIFSKGLRKTWNEINYFILNYKSKNNFLTIDSLSELYEIGLELQDKKLKKECGQYYTPDDVAHVMADWFKSQNGTNICDVACGTGKLILTYFDIIGEKKAIETIRNGNLYLYDLDDIALGICKTIILAKYGKFLEPYIHDISGDFLSKKIVLPENCKVISNPPYAKVNKISNDREKTNVAIETKEIYAMFIEKIIKQSASSVIVTPYSFVGGNKFYSLRKLMNNYNGFMVSFDNVPGNIFCGKKHGIFNSNTTNSVRATITVVENKDNCKGFRLTPIIRFKNEERKQLLKTEVLESFLNDNYQIVSEENKMYCKCFNELRVIWDTWKNKSKQHLCDYVSQDGKYVLSVPNTCRYYTTAFKGIMKRNGKIVLYIDDKDVFNYIFCLINSSFAYWYWRLFDGGITYQKNLLLRVPVFFDSLSKEDVKFFNITAEEMINDASKYIIKKKNVGVQENIKYPRKFRDKINRRFLDILKLDCDEKIFDLIHSNMALEVNI